MRGPARWKILEGPAPIVDPGTAASLRRAIAVIARDPAARHRHDDDVKRVAVGGNHRRLNLDLGAVGAECRMNMVRGHSRCHYPLHAREQEHFARVAVDDPQAVLKIVGGSPAAIGRTVHVPDSVPGIADRHLADDAHFVHAKVDDADANSGVHRCSLGCPRGRPAEGQDGGGRGLRWRPHPW